MNKDTKQLLCPICRSYFTCDSSSINTVALRNHRNRSQFCKRVGQPKRHRSENVSTDRAEKQPKLPEESEQLNTARDHYVPTKALSSSSADEYMETFEVDAMDDGCTPWLDIKQDETVDNESDVEDSRDWFLGNEDASLNNEEVVDYEDLIDNLSLLDENGVPIDIGHLRDCGRMDHDDEEEIDFEVEQVDELGNVANDRKLKKADCIPNAIKKKQDLILLFFFDNMPAKFNRVLGEEVDVDSAIQCLDLMVGMHMSEAEADNFLAFMDRIVSSKTLKPFAMPIRSKTLYRAFLGKTELFFPLEIAELKVLPTIFEADGKKDLKPLCKPFIKLEDALATLLLKLDPSDITHECKPLYERVNGRNQRVYEGFCTGDYPISIQEKVLKMSKDALNGKRILIFYVSTFIDGALMNSGHTRSATPILLTILNDSRKSTTLVGFCAKNLHVSDEEIDTILDSKGVTGKVAKDEIRKLALRQINYDYIYSIIGSFQDLQDESFGFDVQIGLGPCAEYHRVYFVFTNCNGDHPQVHIMTGIKNNACHICNNMHPFNFPCTDWDRDGVGSINFCHEVRNPMRQYTYAANHSTATQNVIKYANELKIAVEKKAEKSKKKSLGMNALEKELLKEKKIALDNLTETLKVEKAELRQQKILLDQHNGRSGEISPYLMFKGLICTGTICDISVILYRKIYALALGLFL